MNSQAIAMPSSQPDTCPYCGQPITRAQREDIRARVRAEEQFRLRALEPQLRAEIGRSLRDAERRRHEATWGAQEEAYRGIERFAGRIQAQVRAIAEGRE